MASVFVDAINIEGLASELPVAVTIVYWSAEVVNITKLNPFVLQVDVMLPSGVATLASFVTVAMDFDYAGGIVQAGPLSVARSALYPAAIQPLQLGLWAN